MPASPSARQSPVGDLSRPGNALRASWPPGTGNPAPSRLALLELSVRLRPRDYAIAHLLHEHTVLTAEQIASVFFSSPITCRHRLTLLRRLHFFDRFLRSRPGHPRPVCWIGGVLSTRYVALASGGAPPSLKALRERQDRILASPVLDHRLGVNDFFTRLMAHARHDDSTRLTRWWSERASAAGFGRRIHPDGHGVWSDGHTSTGFFLEYDTGSESLGKVVGKLAAYRRLRAEGGPSYPVLFVLPSAMREQNLHRKLAEALDSGVAVATTSPEWGTDPAGPVWQVAGNGHGRVTLAELPGAHTAEGPLNPGAPTVDEDPLAALDA